MYIDTGRGQIAFWPLFSVFFTSPCLQGLGMKWCISTFGGFLCLNFEVNCDERVREAILFQWIYCVFRVAAHSISPLRQKG